MQPDIMSSPHSERQAPENPGRKLLSRRSEKNPFSCSETRHFHRRPRRLREQPKSPDLHGEEYGRKKVAFAAILMLKPGQRRREDGVRMTRAHVGPVLMTLVVRKGTKKSWFMGLVFTVLRHLMRQSGWSKVGRGRSLGWKAGFATLLKQ